jgi:hypothetical protein
MQASGNLELVSRAKELLWVNARCDVENISAHRPMALAMLRDLESRAAELKIEDLYGEVVANRS